MPNVYIEARPKGQAREPISTTMSWKIKQTASSILSKRSEKQSIGRKVRAITPLLLGSGT